MDVIFFSFDKRKNSTAVPGFSGDRIAGNLRDSCSIIAPEISFTGVSGVSGFNYAYVPQFSRYYWVTDWVWRGGQWVCTMAVDALASWRDEIGSTSQYVSRSAADYDGNIVDGFYPIKPDAIYTTIEKTDFPWYNTSNRSFVVGITGPNSGGAVTFFHMTRSDFFTFSQVLLGNADYIGTDFGSSTIDAVKAQFNPMQFITSVFAFPWERVASPSVSEIKAGWYTFAVPATINPTSTSFQTVFKIPYHPDSDRGNFVNFAPYTSLELYFPCFGAISIDPAKIPDSRNLACNVYVDYTTGAGVLTIYSNAANGGRVLVDRVTAQVGVPVPLAQISSDYIGAASSAIGGIASIFTGNIAGAISGITNAIPAPEVARSGSVGSFSEFKLPPTLNVLQYRPASDDLTRNGRPLCQTRTISAIPGFIRAENVELEIPCTAYEADEIKTVMEGGFYFE